MRLLFDCRRETLYPIGKEGFSGGSEVYLKQIVRGLAKNGHTVHVVTHDLEAEEQRGPTEWWWPPKNAPRTADVAVQMMHLYPTPEYEADVLVLMTSCIDPDCGPDNQWAQAIDAVPVFSKVHRDLLRKVKPIPPEKCFLTGLGVDLADYPLNPTKIPGRLLYANDPARGLFYLLDIFDLVKREVPWATLHVAYDFERQFWGRAWEMSQMAEMLWETRRRLEMTPGVVSLGALSRAEIIAEELACQVHCHPSDPPGLGTQTHGITQMECAAAGAALVLSDVEAFPEVFGGGATILPVIGRYLPEQQRRVTAEDYAGAIIPLMLDDAMWEIASEKARALAEQTQWSHVVARWEGMLMQLTRKEAMCASAAG